MLERLEGIVTILSLILLALMLATGARVWLERLEQAVRRRWPRRERR